MIWRNKWGDDGLDWRRQQSRSWSYYSLCPQRTKTPSARNKTQKKDLARRRQSEHKFGRQEEEEQEKVVMKGGREVTGRLTNI